MASRKKPSPSKKTKSGRIPTRVTSTDFKFIPQRLTDPGDMIRRAKLFPKKLSSMEILHLQRTVGNLAVRRLLVSKNKGPLVQRKEGEPFGRFKSPKKGLHDYRLYAKWDEAPRGYNKKKTKEGHYFFQSPKEAVWDYPVTLKRGMNRYTRNRFREAVQELQQKLLSALGGSKKAGFGRATGTFGMRTRRAVRRFQKAEKLKETGTATYETWNRLDQRGAVGVKSGRVAYEWEEKLIGGSAGTYGGTASYGWAEKDKKLDVTVAVKFTNMPGQGPTIAKWIQDTWNIFKVTYQKDKDGKKRRTKDTSLDLNFVVKLTGSKKGPTIYPDNEVFLWKGDHPNWKSRGTAAWTDHQRKRRSDAGNWRLDDPGVKTMVAHEFGHLIGLEDEYARSHEDIVRLTGKTPLGTTAKGKLTADQETKYKKLIGGVDEAKRHSQLKAVNETAWKFGKSPMQMEFLAQEYKIRTGLNIHDTFKQKVTDVYWKVKKKHPSYSDLLTTAREERKAGRKTKYRTLVTLTQDRLAKEVWQQWVGKFPDNIEKYTMWTFWGSRPREFVTGGLMGTHTLMDTKKPEDRPNAVAHTHKHPLEPRHVRRFAEYVSRYNNEVWQADYR